MSQKHVSVFEVRRNEPEWKRRARELAFPATVVAIAAVVGVGLGAMGG